MRLWLYTRIDSRLNGIALSYLAKMEKYLKLDKLNVKMTPWIVTRIK